MSNLTWSQIRIIFERYKNDTLPRVSNDLFLDFLNDLTLDVREYLKDINSEDYISSQNITPSSSFQTTALDATFWNILWQNTWVYKLDSNSRITDQIEQVRPWSNDLWFYISWSNIIIKGYENTALQVRYSTKMTDLTLLSDTTIFPDERRYYPSIRNMLDMLYNGWLNDDYKEQRASVKYDQDAINLSQYLRKQDVIITFNQTYL